MKNIWDYRALAREALPAALFDHFDGGVDDEETMRANREGFSRIKLVQKVLRNVGDVSLRTSVLGANLTMPIILAPAGHHGEAHPEGELATARAAARAGIPMILSTGSSYSMEEVRGASDNELWFQLFMLKDRAIVEDLVRRAEALEFSAIVLTVDTQVVGNFQRNRNRLAESLAPMREGNLEPYAQPGQKLVDLFSAELEWADLEWLRGITSLPLVLKGIQTSEDANRSIEAGASLIYVSNHGGRQLDSCLSTIEMLPPIVSAVDGRCEVLVDSGFRRGTDVVKALAMGARAAVFGRPYLYGLAADGEAGVLGVVDLFKTEITRNLQLMGCADVHGLDTSWLRLEPSFTGNAQPVRLGTDPDHLSPLPMG